MARHLTPDDLVAIVDYAITGDRGKNPISTVAALQEFVEHASRRPGMTALRNAAALARVGAWSRPETLLRLALVRFGTPEPVLNQPIPRVAGFPRVLIPDLSWPAFRVAAEYNGAHHDSDGQQVHDLGRMDAYTDVGWSVVNVEKLEFFGKPGSAEARVARRLLERGWQPQHVR
jgi:hypothetical protein